MLFDPLAVRAELRSNPDLVISDDLYVYSYDSASDTLLARGLTTECELEIRVKKHKKAVDRSQFAR